MKKEKEFDTMKIYEVEAAQEYLKWRSEIPSMKFPADWFVRMIPPFGGAVVRFYASLDETLSNGVSVYLDCYDRLGFMGMKPHWEAYPINGDNVRFYLEESDKLLEAIDKELRRDKNEPAVP
jgi:hypothetical protein